VRILFVIDSLGIGGAERQLVELLKGLHATGRYELHLVTLMEVNKGYNDIVDSLGIKIKVFPRHLRYDIISPLFPIAAYIIRYNIDLVHGFLNMGSLFGLLAAKLTRKPVVCSAIRNAKDKSLKEKLLIRFIAKSADITVANSTAGLANRFHQMKPNFKVIYNGLDFSRFDFSRLDREQLRSQLGLLGFDYVVGMVASFSEHKDHETFFLAAREVLRKLPKVAFLLVGDGKMRESLESRVRDLEIKKNVIFAGYREDVDKIYSIMDVCVLLTNAKVRLDGVANSLIEAMVAGVPVIASAGGGTDEFLQNGKQGLVVAPYDYRGTAKAILELLNAQGRVKDLVKEARRQVYSMFNLERYVSDYEELYKGLI